jgi:cephalosporin hydroxylase
MNKSLKVTGGDYMDKRLLWHRIDIVALAALAIFLAFVITNKQQVITRFHNLTYFSDSTWLMNSWMGIKSQQNPNDAWIIQEIISEIKPDLIVETGTFRGGSALMWASVLEQINPLGRVVTIDIKDYTAEARKFPLFQRRVDFLLGSSIAPDIVAQVAERAKGCRTLVILDSDHSKAHVLEEMKCYAPLVQEGGYLIVEDSNINGHPVLRSSGPGPYEAIQEFLSTNKNFKPDKSRERLLLTMHPNGYLKRISRD